MRIDQILPNFSYGDAIGNHTLALRETFRRWGFASDVFAQVTHHRLDDQSRFFKEYDAFARPENILLFHYSIGSPVTPYFARLPIRKVLVYHNITPARFFEGVNWRVKWECKQGRQELAMLTGAVELALGDSEFNRLELEEAGYRPTGVLPIFIPLEDYAQPPDRDFMRAFGDGRPNVLHVGRFAPNKRIEDLVKAFHFFRRLRPQARLVLAGTDVDMENYTLALKDLIRRLGVDDVVFCGHVTFPQLLALYRTAAVYLTMSEHEGFCVPLVEAMATGLPIVAYASSAVPDTLGPAGILFREKDYPAVAEIMEAVVADGGLRSRLAAAGRERLRHFEKPGREAILAGHLRSMGVAIGQG